MVTRPAAPGLMVIPPVPPGTPGRDVITSLGFEPSSVRAVVVTAAAVIGVSSQMPDDEPLPQPPAPEPVPDREA